MEEDFKGKGNLNICQVRDRYTLFKSSTPIQENICDFQSPDCWRENGNTSKVARAISFNPYVSDDATHRSWERRASEVNENIIEAEASFDRDLSYDGFFDPDDTSLLDKMSPESAHRALHNARMKEESGNASLCDEACFIARYMREPEPRLEQVEDDSFGISIFDKDEVSGIIDNKNNKIEFNKRNRNFNNNECKSNEQYKVEINASANLLDQRLNESQIKELNLLEEESSTSNNAPVFRTRCLRFMNSNVRGFWSKKETVENILNKEEVDICVLTETHSTGNNFPEIKNFKTYYRNRRERNKGGIAVLVRESDSKYVTKIAEGEKENEWLALRFTNTSPNLVVIAYYGSQSNSFGVGGKAQIRTHIHELFAQVKTHVQKGDFIQLLGDFNLHIGRERIPKNHMVMDRNGRVFLDWVKECELEFLNNLSDNPTTFVNRSAKDDSEVKKCVLDFVLTNKPEAASNFRTDSEIEERRKFTPYGVRLKRGSTYRVYADHMAILYDIKVDWRNKGFDKTSIWNYAKPGGDIKFDIATSNKFNFLVNKVYHESDINKVMKAFRTAITKSKFQSYGKVTCTERRIKVINDRLIWKQRVKDLNKLEEMFAKEKEANRVYKTRAAVIKGQRDRQTVAIEIEGSTEMVEDLDEIFDHVLLFNQKNMEKVPPADTEVEELMEQKGRIIKEMLEDHNVREFPQELPWKVFLKVMKRVIRQKKGVFRDIIKSGKDFKYALYLFLNRIYSNEELPSDTVITWLTKIWKKKGSRGKLKDNRFIHMKEGIVKFLEKCIVEIISEKINEATPQMQAGSRPGRSTRDQLVKLVIMQKYFEKSKKPLPLLFVDVAACFDKIQLSDVVYDTIMAGADLKATRMIQKFSNVTEIRMTGDFRGEDGKGRGVTVMGTTGQGSNFAPPSIGLTTSKAVKGQFEDAGDELADLGRVKTSPSLYVDDIKVMTNNEEGLRAATVKVGRALQTICLQSHPDKSEVVVSGKTKAAEEVREKLRTDPARMQGMPVKVSNSATYLGMKVSELGHRETIQATAQHRVIKAWGRVKEIKDAINDHRMRGSGWLKAGIILIRAVIIPSLTYSCESWVEMYEYTKKMIVTEYKAIIYNVLDIPTSTKFTSVLADTGLPGILSVIDKLRMTFFSHTMWGKGDEKARELLLEERETLGEFSSLGLIDNICRKYRMPLVSNSYLHGGLVKQRVKLMDEIDTWISNLLSPVTMNVGLNRTRISTNFHRMTKRESQAIIAYNAGNLRLKTAWGEYYKDQSCLVRFCGQRDNLSHLKRCSFYTTTWRDKYYEDIKLLARWLVAVDKERRRRFKGEKLF